MYLSFTKFWFGRLHCAYRLRLSHYSSHYISLNKERKFYESMSLLLHMLFDTLRYFMILPYVVGNSLKITHRHCSQVTNYAENRTWGLKIT